MERATDRTAPDPLQAIRSRIDSIDEAMHRLLIERSGVIAELIEIKGASKPGAAFRPEREADMMRRMAMRHSGALPLATVEHIWREIITTFTAMQAPFGIAVAPAVDALAMRDAVRFYFGFSIPVTDCASVAAAVGRVAASSREIAVLPAEAEGRWWDGLAAPDAPKIFAKLPFLDMPGRPAALPAYVIGPPLKDFAEPDIRVFAAPAGEALEQAVASHGGRIAARVAGGLLLELPVAASPGELAGELGGPSLSLIPLGGFAQPIRYLAERSA